MNSDHVCLTCGTPGPRSAASRGAPPAAFPPSLSPVYGRTGATTADLNEASCTASRSSDQNSVISPLLNTGPALQASEGNTANTRVPLYAPQTAAAAPCRPGTETTVRFPLRGKLMFKLKILDEVQLFYNWTGEKEKDVSIISKLIENNLKNKIKIRKVKVAS